MNSYFAKYKKATAYLLIVAVLSSCNLYKLSKKPIKGEQRINTYIKNNKTSIYNKYVIIHHEDQLYAVENFRLIDTVYNGKLIKVDSLALNYYEKSLIKTNIEIPFKYRLFGKQLHLSIDDLVFDETNEFKFIKSQISQIRTMDNNLVPAIATICLTLVTGATVIIIYVINTINTLIP